MAKDRFSQTGSRVPSELLGKAARYEAARAALLTHMGREDEAQTAIRLQNIYLQRRLDEAGLAYLALRHGGTVRANVVMILRRRAARPHA